jgi:hypothetical protein
MGISTAHAVKILQHYFHNLAVAKVGDTTGLRGSSTAGSVYIGLHTAAPGADQSSHEFTDSAYARQAVARDVSKWTLTSTPDVNGFVFVVNVDAITFPIVAATAETAVHGSVGAEASGATLRIFSAAFSSPLNAPVGEQIIIPAGLLRVQIEVDDAA